MDFDFYFFNTKLRVRYTTIASDMMLHTWGIQHETLDEQHETKHVRCTTQDSILNVYKGLQT